MRITTISLAAVSIALAAALWGCAKESKRPMPETPPDKVVLNFFDLIAKGGRLTTKEAYGMISMRGSGVSPDMFRRWTEEYNRDTKINIIETIVSDKPNADGEYIATVKMQVLTPSMFGDNFTSSSRMNLILDTASNTWKVDFMAETINEKEFQKAPAEARAKPDKET